MRKQTLIGVAPPLAVAKAAASAQEAPAPESIAPAAPAAPAATAANESAQRLATPSPVTSDAPTTAKPASAAERRTSAPPSGPARLNTTDADLRALRPRRGLFAPLLAAAAAAALVYVALNRMDDAPAPQALAETPAQPMAAAAPTPPTMPAAEPTEPVSPTSAADPEPAPVPADTTEPSVSAAAASPAVPGTASPRPGELKRVSLVTDPPGARLFWRGKEMGTTPFVLEIPAGERRSFELGRPGYVTRKLVIDGSRSEISIGLRPDSSASQAGSTRNP